MELPLDGVNTLDTKRGRPDVRDRCEPTVACDELLGLGKELIANLRLGYGGKFPDGAHSDFVDLLGRHLQPNLQLTLYMNLTR